ncbi:LysE family translocator [Anaerosacchariphilus polymeriproducens]|uniref:Lysine transporter LysE n=1 Tax=Anaerosacchariphilus polymeriproducens TaxID=1812858 RepID=A0A371B0A7_9FIRM|nr:LysE family transporter [Anaerosacchariphilus polymeriproducens]RDU25223.1 lysine transporter LysE [Anaerosacchariphilus polymeriproducens]
MIYRGFKFGMLLQLAVGPMCLLVFNTSASHGVLAGLSLVVAITLIDFSYITLSVIGVGAILDKENVKNIIKLFGSVVLVLFGSNMIAEAFHLNLLPSIHLFTEVDGKSIFAQGLILTASNPLTIIFWSGVFSTQGIENHYNKKQLCWFGLGCVLSTLSFLTFIAILGNTICGFLSEIFMQALNIGVGVIIIFSGIRLLLKHNEL